MQHRPTEVRGVGLMLAAGVARRYGSDKRVARLPDGNPLLLASLEVARTVLDEVWLVLRPEDDLQSLGLCARERVVRCGDSAQEMGRSIACGVNAVSRHSSADALFILLADMPWIRSQTLALLHGAASTDRIVVPEYEGQPGHPVVFGRRFWSELLTLEGDQGARQIVRRNPQAVVRVEVDDRGVLLDVDTPDALAAAGGRETN